MKHPQFDLEAGTVSLYVDPIYYDYEYKSRTEDVRWYVDRYLDADGPVLELGVGTGRVALPAVKAGADVTGLDLAQKMLERLEARRMRLPKARRPHLRAFRADMRHFALDQKYATISCPFNAFQHLYTREDAEQCLACVRDHLEPGGVFLLDVLMPDMEYLAEPAFKRKQGIRFKHPTHEAFYVYSEQAAFDATTGLHHMQFLYDKSDERPEAAKAPPHFMLQLTHRYWFPTELVSMLHYNGFEILMHYGDFEGDDLTKDAESQVLVCGLRG
ncbi:MAG: class I SAM-dependent methyltransferase [Bradymonadia bacterium]